MIEIEAMVEEVFNVAGELTRLWKLGSKIWVARTA